MRKVVVAHFSSMQILLLIVCKFNILLEYKYPSDELARQQVRVYIA